MIKNQLEDENVNETLNKILRSNSKIKKIFLNDTYVNEAKKMISKMSSDMIQKLISQKIEQLKQADISEEQKEKLECEVAVLIANVPINYEQNKEYWRMLEENARKNKN